MTSLAAVTIPQGIFHLQQSESIYQCFQPTFSAHAQKLLFRASGQNFDIVIRFSDPDFLKENNNLSETEQSAAELCDSNIETLGAVRSLGFDRNFGSGFS